MRVDKVIDRLSKVMLVLLLSFLIIPVSASAATVQRGTNTLTTTSWDISVDEVDTSNSFILISEKSAGNTPDIHLMTANFTNSSSIHLERYSTTSTTVSWELIEGSQFYVQRGQESFASGDSQKTIAINEVDLSSSFILVTSKINSSTGGHNIRAMFSAEFVNSTAIKLRRAATGTAAEAEWQVVQWDGATVQRGTILPSSTPTTANINSVDLDESFIVTSYRSDGGAVARVYPRTYFVSETQIASFKNTDSGITTVSYFVVSHPDLSVQRGQTGYTSSASSSISEVDTDSTFTIGSYSTNDVSTATLSRIYAERILENSTAISFEKSTATGTNTENWFVVEFSAAPIANNAPTVSNVVLSSTSGNNLTTDNLTVSFDTADADNDSVKGITNWLVNSNSIAVLNMPFEGGSNSTQTEDYSGNSNDGAVDGATWNSTAGYDGFGAYEFDGSNDQINITQNSGLAIDSDFSLEARVKFDSAINSSTNAVFIWRLQSGANYNYYLGISGGKLVVTFYDASPAWTETTYDATSFSADTWYHVVGTWDNSTKNQSLYLDGTLVNSTTHAGLSPWTGGTQRVVLGGNNGNSVLDGALDEAAIYNITLSSEQVNALYNNRTDLIVSQETTINDTWQCDVTPNDGTEDGSTVQSNTLTIVEADTTPPASVTNLANQSAGETWIYWNWTNPADPDFDKAIVYIDSVWKVNTSNNYYNATGLSAGTSYTITVHTKDTTGNVNDTDVNSTAQTEAAVAPFCGDGICNGGETCSTCAADCGRCGGGGSGRGTTLTTTCESNWTCTEWTACTNNYQIRACIDSNNCGITTGKPIEKVYCGLRGECVVEWQCTDWNTCINNIQTRVCTDKNSCGIINGKPAESQDCISLSGESVTGGAISVPPYKAPNPYYVVPTLLLLMTLIAIAAFSKAKVSKKTKNIITALHVSLIVAIILLLLLTFVKSPITGHVVDVPDESSPLTGAMIIITIFGLIGLGYVFKNIKKAEKQVWVKLKIKKK